MDATAHSPVPATDLPYLTGRTVTDGMNTGVVTAAEQDVCTVRWADAGFTERCATLELTAVNPDRPSLAHDELYANELGRILAERAGRTCDWQGEPTRQVGWREAARDVLRRLDGRALAAKHARCPHTYVVDRDGARRDDPIGFEPGDRLVTCTFYGDGPGRFRCGPHADDRGSIFQPTPAGMRIPDGCGEIRDVVALTPFETAVPARVAVAA